MSRRSLNLFLLLILASLFCPVSAGAKEEDAASPAQIQEWLTAGRNAYYGGFSQPIDYALARSLFEKAAEYGHPEALYMLGSLYYDGKSVPKNERKGMELYVKAAQKGQPDAQMIVANQHMYLAMRQPPESKQREAEYALAADLFSKAAAQGQPEAIMWYGDMQIKGLGGLKRNEEKGLALVRKAADLHNANAHAMLASYHMEGTPLVKDFQKAYMHMLISQEEGNKNAVFGLKMLEKSLKKDEIKAAKEAAAQWQQAHPKPKNKSRNLY